MSEPRYSAIDFDFEDHFRDLTKSVIDGHVACIVDNDDGIIAYVLGAKNTNLIVDRLNLLTTSAVSKVFVRRCRVCGMRINVGWGPDTYYEAQRLLVEHVESSHSDREIRAWAMEHLMHLDFRKDK